MGWFESRSNEERGNFAGRVGERRQRQSFGNLEAHFRALRCVRVIVFPYLFVYNSWHRMHGFSQRERERERERADVATTSKYLENATWQLIHLRLFVDIIMTIAEARLVTFLWPILP